MRTMLRRYKWVWLLVLAFLLGEGASYIEAQVGVGGGRSTFSILRITSGGIINWNGGDLTLTHSSNSLALAGGVLAVPAGSNSAPAINFTTEANTGIYTSGASTLDFTLTGTNRYTFNYAFLSLNFDGQIRLGANNDLILHRDAAATLQLGADTAVPTAQTLKGPDGSGAEKPGGDLSIAAGRSTGTNAPGAIYFKTGTNNTLGSEQGPLVTRLTIASTGRFTIASHTQFNVASSTTGAASALLGGNAPVGQVSAPYVWIAAIASDGTAIWIPGWR